MCEKEKLLAAIEQIAFTSNYMHKTTLESTIKLFVLLKKIDYVRSNFDISIENGLFVQKCIRSVRLMYIVGCSHQQLY